MNLIVEAGTTKTDAVLINTDGSILIQTASTGINPVSDPDYQHAIDDLVMTYRNRAIQQIFYYGSGCINEEVNEGVANRLRKGLQQEPYIEIADDLLGVARGLCQRIPGIASILGTGSNIGYYDGKSIIDGIKSGGYLIGDEGSGFKIGQSIYSKFARGQLSSELSEKITQEYGVKQEDAVGQLYQQTNPRQHLASFAKAINWFEGTTKREIMTEVFNSYVNAMVLPIHKKYPVPVHIVGSIGVHFKEYLIPIFEKFNILAASIERSPLDGLIRYHSNE